jgi:hypothetical protein
MGKARLLLIFVVAFACGFAFRAGVQSLKVQQFGNQRYREGHAAGVEQMRREAALAGHASYQDRDGDMISDFQWNESRPHWTGGRRDLESGAVKSLAPMMFTLIQ